MRNTLSRGAPLVVGGVLIALAATGNLFEASPMLIAAQLSAAGLAVWARHTFPPGSFRVVATPGGETLLQRGPYRHIRHPMYAAALLLTWSGVVSHLLLWTVAAGGFATLAIVTRIVVEERFLPERYAGYAQYAEDMKALIPFVA